MRLPDRVGAVALPRMQGSAVGKRPDFSEWLLWEGRASWRAVLPQSGSAGASPSHSRHSGFFQRFTRGRGTGVSWRELGWAAEGTEFSIFAQSFLVWPLRQPLFGFGFFQTGLGQIPRGRTSSMSPHAQGSPTPQTITSLAGNTFSSRCAAVSRFWTLIMTAGWTST